jgi:hypothetical protein
MDAVGKISKKFFGYFIHPMDILQENNQRLFHTHGKKKVFNSFERPKLAAFGIKDVESRIVYL